MVREQRKHQRHLTDIVVFFRNSSPNLLVPEQGEGVIENVSMGGLFLMTEDPLAVGTTVDLKFDVGGPGTRHGAVRARAVVRWTRTRFPPSGMGLEFNEFFHGKKSLEDWLAEMAKLR